PPGLRRAALQSLCSDAGPARFRRRRRRDSAPFSYPIPSKAFGPKTYNGLHCSQPRPANMHTPEFDIVISGAGPVGSALALLLARIAPAPQRIALLGRNLARSEERRVGKECRSRLG